MSGLSRRRFLKNDKTHSDDDVATRAEVCSTQPIVHASHFGCLQVAKLETFATESRSNSTDYVPPKRAWLLMNAK